MLCEATIGISDAIVDEPGGPLHAECWSRVSRATRAVTRFVRSRPSASLCHACLAARLCLDERIVRRAAWRLRRSPNFHVGLRPCADCGLRRMTTTSVASQAAKDGRPRGRDIGHVLAEFGVAVEDRICLALSGSGVVDSSALREVADGLVTRGARRVYVLDFDGVSLDNLRENPRLVVVAPVAPIAGLHGLPERPSLAVADLRLGVVGDSLRWILALLNPWADALVRVRLDFLLRLPAHRDPAYASIRCRVAILGTARSAIHCGWHVAGVAPASPSGATTAPAFFLHLTRQRRRGKDLDAMVTQTVEALA